MISQNLAGLHEIANINTRKIVTIAKSQKIVLANNSNNKVLLNTVAGDAQSQVRSGLEVSGTLTRTEKKVHQ